MIDDKSLQDWLFGKGYLAAQPDGIWGPKSAAAATQMLIALRVNVTGWNADRQKIAINQAMLADLGLLHGAIDGLYGPDTQQAVESWQDHDRSRVFMPEGHPVGFFPRERDCLTYYGPPGENHIKMMLPYPMRLAWDKSVTIRTIAINAKCAKSANRALTSALSYYGGEKIRQLGLDLYGGCYANRPKRGASTLSMHAYACAIDIDPEHNQLRWGRDKARMAQPEYQPFIDAWEAEGWVSLGRSRNYDWMHFQAARL